MQLTGQFTCGRLFIFSLEKGSFEETDSFPSKTEEVTEQRQLHLPLLRSPIHHPSIYQTAQHYYIYVFFFFITSTFLQSQPTQQKREKSKTNRSTTYEREAKTCTTQPHDLSLISISLYLSRCLSLFPPISVKEETLAKPISQNPSQNPMSSWVLSECALKPFPPHPRSKKTKCLSKDFIFTTKPTSRRPTDPCRSLPLASPLISSRHRDWGLKVSVPLRVALPEEEEIEEEKTQEAGFDPGSPPPFNLAEIRAAIPKHCWIKDPWRSMSYVVRDVVVVFGLAAAAAYVNNWVVWPLYWAAQGTMFWALFVLGHDWYVFLSLCSCLIS